MWTNLEALPPTKCFLQFTDAMSSPGNSSDHPEPSKKQQQPSRVHREMILTIQDPPGNDSNHPLGNNREGPYTKSPPLNFWPSPKKPSNYFPPGSRKELQVFLRVGKGYRALAIRFEEGLLDRLMVVWLWVA